jgi:radical SAM superfamily enzyme YgiQ (UPF0313 family)
MTGFRSFGNDVGFLGRLKRDLPEAKVVCFGYLAGLYPREILEREGLDGVIAGEPELAFSAVYDRLMARQGLEGIPGVTFRSGTDICQNPAPVRIRDLDTLPFPDHSLAKPGLYSESFLGRPIAATATARGCPFQCTFCVRMYGQEVIYRSAQNVIAEVQTLRNQHGIPNIRFMDDTFTLNRERTLEICQGIRESTPDLRWTCLSRIDALDGELLYAMTSSGCRRLYLGIESGSQRILDAMRKHLSVETIRQKMKLIKASGPEVSGFLIAGFPGETDEDHQATVRLIREIGLDYIIATKAQCWPGTHLFESSGRQDFDPWNPHSEGAPKTDAVGFERERDLYRRFYLRLGYALKTARKLFTSPDDLLRGALHLVRYAVKARGGDDDFI